MFVTIMLRSTRRLHVRGQTTRVVAVAATAAVMLAVGTGTAMAAGQQVCVGAAGTALRTPQASGQCRANATLTTLANESELSDLRSAISTLQTRVSTLESDNATLKDEVSALQSTLTGVSYKPSGLNGRPTLEISGENVQIDSGAGATDAAVNGLGNLFIGYDENTIGAAQTGSNNLVLGNNQTFTSYGGLLAGARNVLSGPFSAVFGLSNTASGVYSSISGGVANLASGGDSAVSGGVNNTASGPSSSVTGGRANTASADSSSVSGGTGNLADGIDSSVSGGSNNTASGFAAAILGAKGVNVSTDFGTSP
jgi:hypothetical protein